MLYYLEVSLGMNCVFKTMKIWQDHDIVDFKVPQQLCEMGLNKFSIKLKLLSDTIYIKEKSVDNWNVSIIQKKFTMAKFCTVMEYIHKNVLFETNYIHYHPILLLTASSLA